MSNPKYEGLAEDEEFAAVNDRSVVKKEADSDDKPRTFLSGTYFRCALSALVGFVLLGPVGALLSGFTAAIFPGCCTKGGVIRFLLLLVLAVVIVFGLMAASVHYFGHHLARQAGEIIIPQVTTDQPLDLPRVYLCHSKLEKLEQELKDFHHALHHGHAPPHDLVLTEQDINGLICSKEKLCGHAHATIQDSILKVDFSMPADDAPGGQGRFFVGSKSLSIVPQESSTYNVQHTAGIAAPNDKEFTLFNTTVSADFEHAYIEILRAEVLGWAATDAFVDRFFLGKNWANHMCHYAKESIRHIKGVVISDDKIVVQV